MIPHFLGISSSKIALKINPKNLTWKFYNRSKIIIVNKWLIITQRDVLFRVRHLIITFGILWSFLAYYRLEHRVWIHIWLIRNFLWSRIESCLLTLFVIMSMIWNVIVILLESKFSKSSNCRLQNKYLHQMPSL